MTFHKYLGDSKMFEYDKHYRECQQQNKPFIKAKTSPSHKNYFVQIDLMTCDYELSKPEQDDIQKLVENEMEYVKSNTKFDFQGFSIDKELAWFDGISSEHLDEFCVALYDLTQKNHH
ncbi:MAG: hypothetical protein ISR81_03455 [Nitrosopumilus sp.]|nr:hypothetical protein [Nitrosopumilus sp.]MBL7015458.1 hypothetical protein [Nitrosopumilus sp.]MBL7017953.1 hypothetical protein [Nitrosopumilus sp.]